MIIARPPRLLLLLCSAYGSTVGQPSSVHSVLFARAPVLGLCFFVSVTGGRVLRTWIDPTVL